MISTTVGPAVMSGYTEPFQARPSCGTLGVRETVKTNYFSFRFPENLVLNQYDVAIYTKSYRKKAAKRDKDGNEKATKTKTGTEIEKLEENLADFNLDDFDDTAHINPLTFNRRVFNLFQRTYKDELGTIFAYDGRSIAYAPKEMNRTCLEKKFHLVVDTVGMYNDKTSRYRAAVHVYISIKHVSVLDFKKYKKVQNVFNQRISYLMALDVILMQIPLQNGFIQQQNIFVHPNQSKPLLKIPAAEVWEGFTQSVRQIAGGVAINIDLGFASIWKGSGKPLFELCKSIVGREKNWSQADQKKIVQSLKEVTILTLHTARAYRIFGFSANSAQTEMCSVGPSQEKMSIQKYFAKTYNIRLKYPQLLCVRVHAVKNIYVPMELLLVAPNQRYPISPIELQNVEMPTIARKQPASRLEKIVSIICDLGYSSSSFLKTFNISVDEKPVYSQGRMLPSPYIFLNEKSGNTVKKSVATRVPGGWNIGNRQQFCQTSRIRNWFVLNASSLSDTDVSKFALSLKSSAQRRNLFFGTPTVKRAASSREIDIASNLRQISRMAGSFEFVLVVIPKQSTTVHAAIKSVGDVECGLPTQVVVENNVRKSSEMTIENILLKINGKIGGVNQEVAKNRTQGMSSRETKLRPENTIILGADVTHPGRNKGLPSVAAIVATLEKEHYTYAGEIQKQLGGEEVIRGLGELFKKLYEQWVSFVPEAEKNRRATRAKKLLHSVIMFRDGVSESQFREVMNVEVTSLRQACKEICEKEAIPNINVTYLIVTKRHHTRLFSERNDNVKPGLVLDTDIVSEDFYDFYLNSHHGIIGTNKSSKYTVLVDENSISPDELQEFIFRMTHTSSRCNRSTSIVTSAYYAHLLAYRGREYIYKGINQNVGRDNRGVATKSETVQNERVPVRLGNGKMFWL